MAFVYRNMVWLRTARRLHWFKAANNQSGDHNPHTTFRSGRFDAETHCGIPIVRVPTKKLLSSGKVEGLVITIPRRSC